jgi:aspartate aminotransferase-like enzyme
MDEVTQLARGAFVTRNKRCLAVSGCGEAGLEAALNSLAEPGDCIAVAGGAAFVERAAEIARRCGATISAWSEQSEANLVVLPHIDPWLCEAFPIREIAAAVHARGGHVVVDATLSLAATELRVDDWQVDACVAGVDFGVGAPRGMVLVTYTEEMEGHLRNRALPPRTSFLDLGQLQAYWSPERLNHHTAPTSLIYGLREALRLVHLEGIQQRWRRHADLGDQLRSGLRAMGLQVRGDAPYALIDLPPGVDEDEARAALLANFGVYVGRAAPRTWRLGLLGADARPQSLNQLLLSLKSVLAL